MPKLEAQGDLKGPEKERAFNLDLGQVPEGYEPVVFDSITPGEYVEVWDTTITERQTRVFFGQVKTAGIADEGEHVGSRYIVIEGHGVMSDLTLYADNERLIAGRRFLYRNKTHVTTTPKKAEGAVDPNALLS